MMVLALFAWRALRVVVLFLAASAVLFVALRVLPGDAGALWLPLGGDARDEAARLHLGLERPLVAQYAAWVGQVAGGELGFSVQHGRRVAAVLAEAVAATLELAVAALAVAGVLGLAGGLVLFALRGEAVEAVESLAETGTALMMSVPEFVWALLFILVVGVALEALPFAGRLDPGMARPVVTGFLLLDTLLVGDFAAWRSAVRHMALPALALGVAFAPPVMRVLRGALLEAYRSKHVRQARLRGVSEGGVLLRHVLRPVALPLLALAGAQAGLVLGGALLVEVIHAYPGMGRRLVEAVRHGDLAVAQAVGLAYCALVLGVRLGVEGLSLVLDPRWRAR
jgi:ABC-type dipeptide/oligopeptide/nickel transport system permease component